MTAVACIVHETHHPRSHVNEMHHVWPKGYHGPNIKDNLIPVCATGHNNIHQLMDIILKIWTKAGKMISIDYQVVRMYAVDEKKYALLGARRAWTQSMEG